MAERVSLIDVEDKGVFVGLVLVLGTILLPATVMLALSWHDLIESDD